jgi:hypothetical protein
MNFRLSHSITFRLINVLLALGSWGSKTFNSCELLVVILNSMINSYVLSETNHFTLFERLLCFETVQLRTEPSALIIASYKSRYAQSVKPLH